MNYGMTVAQVKTAIQEKLSHIYGVSSKNASDEEFYKASALVVRDLLMLSLIHISEPTRH